MIYFAQSTDGGPIKIGCTADVPQRIGQLEAQYGRHLALLGTLPGGPDEEAAIHARFDHIRLKSPDRPNGQGRRHEQFRPTPELMAFIGRPLLVGADPDAVEVMPMEIRTIGIRTTKGWADWLERAAKHSRITVAAFLDRAAADHARATGFDEPPPERLP